MADGAIGVSRRVQGTVESIHLSREVPVMILRKSPGNMAGDPHLVGVQEGCGRRGHLGAYSTGHTYYLIQVLVVRRSRRGGCRRCRSGCTRCGRRSWCERAASLASASRGCTGVRHADPNSISGGRCFVEVLSCLTARLPSGVCRVELHAPRQAGQRGPGELRQESQKWVLMPLGQW